MPPGCPRQSREALRFLLLSRIISYSLFCAIARLALKSPSPLQSWLSIIEAQDAARLSDALENEALRATLWSDDSSLRDESPLVLCVANEWLEGARMIVEKGGDGSDSLDFRDPRSTPIFHRSIVLHAARKAIELKNNRGAPFFDLLKEQIPLDDSLRLPFIGSVIELSIFSFAAFCDCAFALEWLLPRCNPRKRDHGGVTPFMWAASGNAVNALKLLAPASDRSAVSDGGETALMRAASTPLNASAAVLWLANKKGANKKSLHGETALMLAVESPLGFDRAAILAPISDVNARNNAGDTALLCLCGTRSENNGRAAEATVAIARLLVDHGARLDLPSRDGRMPIELAIDRQMWRTADLFATRLPEQALSLGLREKAAGKLPEFEALMQARDLSAVVAEAAKGNDQPSLPSEGPTSPTGRRL